MPIFYLSLFSLRPCDVLVKLDRTKVRFLKIRLSVGERGSINCAADLWINLLLDSVHRYVKLDCTKAARVSIIKKSYHQAVRNKQ